MRSPQESSREEIHSSLCEPIPHTRLRAMVTIGRMLGPSRPFPRVGARARIAHFGGGFEPGTVVAVSDEGRRLRVRGETGDMLEFVLSPATARFVAADVAHGSRLELLG